MRRLHVIDEPHRMGGEIYYREDKFAHDPELLEAYHCGKKDGWREAMRESEHEGHYAERHYGHVGMPPMYREHDYIADDEPSYRRHRDSMGRYVR